MFVDMSCIHEVEDTKGLSYKIFTLIFMISIAD
jgi:hypothetical protein